MSYDSYIRLQTPFVAHHHQGVRNGIWLMYVYVQNEI